MRPSATVQRQPVLSAFGIYLSTDADEHRSDDGETAWPELVQFFLGG